MLTRRLVLAATLLVGTATCFTIPLSSSRSPSQLVKTVALQAATPEEDLELTRQIILGHLGSSGSAAPAATVDDSTEEDAAPPPAAAAAAAVDDKKEEAEAPAEPPAAASADDSADEEQAEATVVEEPSAPAAVEDDEPVVAAAASETNGEASSDTDNKTYRYTDRPTNDLMMRAAVGETVEQTPLWLFRQAGRHLPEYQAYKEEKSMNFLQLLETPETVAECTMQPLRRYDVDAAILFSDILVVPQALGIEVTMPGGVGIQVPQPLASPDEVTTRLPPIDDITPAFVQDKLGHVIASVTRIRQQMDIEGKSIPLIGFSAAPWTLLFYMVGGSSKKNTDAGMTWLKEHRAASTALLDLLTKIVIEYMAAQVEAGAHMLQVFEAMGMMLDDKSFEQYALPCLKQIAAELKKRYPTVPLMVFARGACHLNYLLKNVGYDVITIDGSVNRNTARYMVGNGVTLQGNYDPAELIEANEKTVETVQASARDMLEALGAQRLIANLGEGLGGKESPALVDAFVKAIHDESAAMIAAQSAAAAASPKKKNKKQKQTK